MKITDAFPRRFFRAEDIDQPVTLEILQVLTERFPNGNKPIVYFSESEKGLVLNETTFQQIVEATGVDDSEEWSGEKITLVREQVVINNKPTAYIRVRKPKILLRKK